MVGGEIEVAAGDARVRARSSEMACVTRTPATTPAVEPVSDVYEGLRWLGQFVAFESIPLIQVVEEFRRRFGLEIEIDDQALERRTVKGCFTPETR